jgi:hypothetical protein
MTTAGWIFVVGLWVLFFWLYRDYRLDAFRQDLFVLRDELFGLAAKGKVPFDSKAYGMLRSSINGNIQFGHRCGFLDILCFFLFTRRDECRNRAAEAYRAKWSDAVSTLNPEARAAIEDIRTRMHLRIAQQIISTSAVLMVTLVTLLGWVLLCVVRNAVVRTVSNWFSRPRIGQYLDLFDSASVLRMSHH